MAMIAPALPLPGGGKMRMQPVYVEDVVGAIMAGLGPSGGQLSQTPQISISIILASSYVIDTRAGGPTEVKWKVVCAFFT